jgi:HAD superfamily hydrolase (TIGR01509 family)
MPRLILLDFDGTLADSLKIMRGVYGNFLAVHGITDTAPDFEALNGPPIRSIVAQLKAGHGLRGSLPELVAQYERLIDKAYQAVAPGPGARDLLSACKAAGWTSAIVSSNSRSRIGSWLAQTGLSDDIAFVVGGEDVARGKPAPDAYFRAMTLGQCPPDATVAVEDSDQGAAAARAAGLRTYGLASSGTQRWPLNTIPIHSLAALPELLAQLPVR